MSHKIKPFTIANFGHDRHQNPSKLDRKWRWRRYPNLERSGKKSLLCRKKICQCLIWYKISKIVKKCLSLIGMLEWKVLWKIHKVWNTIYKPGPILRLSASMTVMEGKCLSIVKCWSTNCCDLVSNLWIFCCKPSSSCP